MLHSFVSLRTSAIDQEDSQSGSTLISDTEILQLSQLIRSNEVTQFRSVDEERSQFRREGDVKLVDRIAAYPQHSELRKDCGSFESIQAIVIWEMTVSLNLFANDDTLT